MKYFKSKYNPGRVYRLVHTGQDYVYGVAKDAHDVFNNTIRLYNGEWEEWTDEPQVGDKVRVKGKPFTYDLLYIHDGGETYNGEKWAVYAYKCDKPYTCRLSELEKVE